MNEKQKDLLIRYAGIILFAVAFTVIYITTKKTEGAENYRVLSDAFVIPGVLICGYGLLTVVYDTGTLDGPIYGLTNAFKSLLPGGRLRIEKYSDWVEKKRAKRNVHYVHLLVVGGIFIAIGIVFMLLYNRNI